jgi:signal transduction histidine kinase/ligand-binding sensor domain-containing protein/ActR/RegA family two-component response regulator
MERKPDLDCSPSPRTRLAARIAVVCLLAVLAALPARALDPHVRVTQYHTLSFQIEQGLPQNSVQAILQSRDGYLWLGTQAGLVRFDGVRFVVFDRSNVSQFTRENVRALVEDRNGGIWIATDDGLLVLRNGQFSRVGTSAGLPSQLVLSLLIARDGTLWVGTEAGLCRLKDGRQVAPQVLPGTEDVKATRITEGRDGTVWLSTAVGLVRVSGDRVDRPAVGQGVAEAVYDVYQDRGGRIWVGTSHGLARLVGNRLERVSLAMDDSVHAVFEDSAGTLWLGLERRGIARWYDDKLEVYGTAEGLPGNYVTGFLEDRQGNLWLAGFDSGLTCLRQTPFSGFGAHEGLPSSDVQTILQTRSGDVWMGTNSAGLARLSGGRLTLFSTKDGLPDEVILSLAEGRDGAVWVGTPRGLARISNGRVSKVADPKRLLNQGVRALLESADGTLWIGTRYLGLVAMRNGALETVRPPGDAISPSVQALLLSRSGDLWIAGSRGLTQVHEGRARTFTTRDGLKENHILSLYEDGDGAMWAGTFGGGLSRVEDGVQSITDRQGLFDNNAFAILEDDHGDLWMSCNKGIYKVPKAEVLDVFAGRRSVVHSVGYGVADGLRGTEGNGGTQPPAWKMADGRLWFAGIRGAAIVDPRPVNVATPTVLIERMVYGRNETTMAGNLELDPGTGDVTFDYTAPDYHAARSLQFRYKLPPFKEEWEDASERRTAFFTNVPPGSYAFMVQARNKGGEWSEPASFAFRIQPHYYQATWFYALGALMAGVLATSVYGLRVRRMRTRERTLARLVDARTAELRAENDARRQTQTRLEREIAEREQVQEELVRAMARAEAANQAKGTFLANMSHEVRTPMNGILGMTELLLDSSLNTEQREHLGMVRSSALSLLGVINDVLDFSKIDAGRMEIEAIPFHVRDFIRQTVPPLTALAADRGLELRWSVDSDVPETLVGDPGRLRQVILNLVGNSIKFTESGSVALIVEKLRQDGQSITLSVQVHDTGIGIPADKLQAVFEPFTQADGSMTRRYGGTGLGLTITAQLVRLMGGEVRVDSQVGSGTTFSFTVKLGLLPTYTRPEEQDAPEAGESGPAAQSGHGLRVLVAEDNLVNQRLISRLLEKWGHQAVIVPTGERAVEATANSHFDLVLMDVQMPGMDGFEATHAIRAREAATGRDHLAIVALTAHAMKGDRERCLEAGMDGYLSKPVEAAELKRTIAEMTSEPQ